MTFDPVLLGVGLAVASIVLVVSGVLVDMWADWRQQRARRVDELDAGWCARTVGEGER